MKRIGSWMLAAVGLTFLSGAPAHAQAAAPCELHVFITPGFAARGHFATVVPGVGIGDYLKPYEDVAAMLREYLAPDVQAEMIRAADVPKILGLSGYQVIVEPPLEFRSKDMKGIAAEMSTGPRFSAPRAPCYAEIRVVSEFYEKTALSRMLYSWFVFRQFDGDTIVMAYNTAKATQVDAFPAKDPSGADAARADARNAFQANLLRFLSSSKFKKLKR